MTIRKLVKDIRKELKLTLESWQAIVYLECDDEKVCLLLDNPTDNCFSKLKKFNNVTIYKYFGDLKVFNKLTQVDLDWPKPTEKVLIETKQDITFCPDSGNLLNEIVLDEKPINYSEKVKNVLIIDDSKTIQKLLSKIIADSNKLEVVAIASSPSEAKTILESGINIELITLDIHMPEMNGVEFLKTYLQNKKIPTVMISSVSINEGPLVMEALSSGAETYIQKPSMNELSQMKEEIIEKLEAVSCVSKKSTDFIKSKLNQKFNDLNGLVAIGSSTGGTQALQLLFESLPNEIPPFVVVQHIPAVFSKALADRLNKLCHFTVKEAEDGEFLKENTIYIAPGGKQMKILKRGSAKKVIINDDEPVNRFKPSVDYLFNSLLSLEEKNLTGVILTGMGKDGAKGLLELKKYGAATIAQDEASCVVFGMPKAAIALDAAQEVVPLKEIVECIIKNYNKNYKLLAA